MGLFKRQKNKKGQPYAFMFLCRGPYSPFSANYHPIGRNDENIKRNISSTGFSVPEKNIVVYSEDWNDTHYSSMELLMEGEYDDMISKVENKLKAEGYCFDFGNARIMKSGFKKGSSYDMLGLWLLIIIFP